MTTVYLDPDLRDGLKLLKQRDGIPEAEAIRRALRQWLGERKALPKAARRGKKTE